jgi:hypothetical protein
MGALAIDMGNLYVARSSLQKAADAGAFAGASGLVIDQSTATARATNFTNQNIAAHNTVNGAVAAVSFPAANQVRVTASHPAVNLFLGGIVGVTTAPVTATATARFSAVGAVPPGLVPLAIYCNQPGGCTPGDLRPFNNPRPLQRFCGNFFLDGANGSACGNPIAPGETFLQGITITQNSDSNAVFRDEVYQGYQGTVARHDQVGALPGNRNGWKDGMTDRLLEAALDPTRREMTVAVIRPIGSGVDMEIIDFVRIRVHSFSDVITAGTGVGGGGPGGGGLMNTDITTFEVIEYVSNGSPSTPGQGLGINSVVKLELTE